jgi:hypothetical protein
MVAATLLFMATIFSGSYARPPHSQAETSTQYILKRQPVSFGDYVTGNVFWPKNMTATSATATTTSDTAATIATSSNRSPRSGVGASAVIWLHPYSYATGALFY